MKVLQILAVALFTMFAISLVGVTTSSAIETAICGKAPAGLGLWGRRTTIVPDGCEEELPAEEGAFELYEIELLLALWLEGGVPVSGILPTETEGELTFLSLNGGDLGVTTSVLCSGIFNGWVGPGSLDQVSELLTLGRVLVPVTALVGTALLCTNDGSCIESEVWAVELPWETEVNLLLALAATIGGGTFFDDTLFNAAWYIQCLIFNITVSETCRAPEIDVEVKNEANGTVDTAFSDEFQELGSLKLATCTLGGSETGEIEGLQIILEPGVSLSVSSE